MTRAKKLSSFSLNQSWKIFDVYFLLPISRNACREFNSSPINKKFFFLLFINFQNSFMRDRGKNRPQSNFLFRHFNKFYGTISFHAHKLQKTQENFPSRTELRLKSEIPESEKIESQKNGQKVCLSNRKFVQNML